MGEASVTAIYGKLSLCRTCYLTVLNSQKATENVDARIHALRGRVSSAHAFFQARNERVVFEPSATLSESGRSISSQKEIHCH